jgi:hypothetical protein
MADLNPGFLLRLILLPLLPLLALAAWGCDEAPGMSAAQPETSTPTTPPRPAGPEAEVPPDAIAALEGAVATIGPCRVGVVLVANDHAVFATFREGTPETRQKVRKGQLLAACGALHRLVGFQFLGSSGAPGGSGRSALIDPRPAAGIALSAGSIVLTVEGTVSRIGPAAVGLKELALEDRNGRPSARLKVTRANEPERLVEAAAGELLELGPARHRVLDIKNPDATLGVPGWIEISGTAE